MNRLATRLALVLAPVLFAPAALAQVGFAPPDACRVVHVSNMTKGRLFVILSADAQGLVRVAGGWVDACSTTDIPLVLPTLRCGATYHVNGEVKDASKVPVAIMNMNPAAAPTIAAAKTTVTPQNAKDPTNWIVLADSGKGTVGWSPLPAGSKPPGCPPAGAMVAFTFNNASAAPVKLIVAGQQGAAVNNACIPGRQSRTWQVPASSAYKMQAMPALDPQCLAQGGDPVALAAAPVKGVVTVDFVAKYGMQQAGLPIDQPNPEVPGGGTTSTQDTVSKPPPDTSQPTQSVPTGK